MYYVRGREEEREREKRRGCKRARGRWDTAQREMRERGIGEERAGER